jgi:diaminohydroxyphosphoribosylaminopyrimidine deaminase / 5-amino-6-(5-phosphoribosylamino)uracil reductase
MQRCIELAKLGAGKVMPNPMVGAVLVYDDKIIGEGWHQQYGGPHAEVHAVRDAKEKGFSDLISQSTLYVSLEPCAHVGKTPPCTDLIIQHKIPAVVIGSTDPFKAVNGKGIDKLKKAGVNVQTGVLEKECNELNKRFFTFHTKLRPYIILKWAQTGDGFMAHLPTNGKVTTQDVQRLLISNEYSNRIVHQWRSEEAAILIGTNTALHDDPSLTTRLWPGASPMRLIIDMNLRLPVNLKVFDGTVKTIVFNSSKQEEKNNLLFYKLDSQKKLIPQLLQALFELNIQSVLVEGGVQLLQSFIDAGSWDEARIITNKKLLCKEGLAAPVLKSGHKISTQQVAGDQIDYFRHDTDE